MIVNYFKRLVNFTKYLVKDKPRLVEYSVYVISLLLFIVNGLYLSYLDEFVNLIAGKYILWGKLPYRDFFDHHLPFAWYLSALIEIISFGSFILFRFWWAILMFIGFFQVGRYLKKVNKELFSYYLVFILFYPLVAVYYWLHIFTADALAAWFFSILLWVLFSETYRKEVDKKTIYICSWLTFALVFSSMTFVYLAAILYLWQLYLLLKKKFVKKDFWKFVGFCSAPYLLYGLFLLFTGTFKDFYISNVVYNTTLYMDVPNYTRGKFFNPVKFALTIIFNFYERYLPLLTKIKELDLYLRGEVLFGLSTFLLLFLVFFENKILFLILFLILSFSNPRSDVFVLNESNYQAGIFIAFGLSSVFLVLYRQTQVNLKKDYQQGFKKVGVILLFTLTIFNGLFFLKNTYDKWFKRYTQIMPSVNDKAYAAEFFDEILTKNDYFWIGPYEPDQVYFVKKAQPVGKYATLLPQFREADYFKYGFLEQFDKHPPALIVYKHDASIFMTPAMEFGSFFLDYLNGKYTNIESIKGIEVLRSPTGFTLKTDLYLQNSRQAELLIKLRTLGYIK